MTETLELQDRLVSKAKKLSGINDSHELVNMALLQ
jgi:hypothetical protein